MAVEFAAFCTRNPKPCPLIEITPPGDPEPARSGPGADIRTDLPGYRVYRHGQLVEKRGEIRDLWRDDLVAFLLGCSLTFEHALIEAGVGVRNVELGTLVPMFVSSLACRPAGRFHGFQVVTMRPIPERQVQLARDVTRGYPHAHGAPVHIGNPEANRDQRSGSTRLWRARRDPTRRSAGLLGLWSDAASSGARIVSGIDDHPRAGDHVPDRPASRG